MVKDNHYWLIQALRDAGLVATKGTENYGKSEKYR